MSGIQFHDTVYGRRFFEHQLPKLIGGVERLSEDVERLASAIERQNELKEYQLGFTQLPDIKDVIKEFTRDGEQEQEPQ